jgi:hypothetical protein
MLNEKRLGAAGREFTKADTLKTKLDTFSIYLSESCWYQPLILALK